MLINKHILNGFLVYRIIEKHIKRRQPLSLIRLGDGEGALLGYPSFTSQKNVEGIGKVWFGEQKLKEEDFLDLSRQLKDAVRNADIVGVPRKKQINKNPLYGAVMRAAEEFSLIAEGATLTDAAVHRYLQFALLYRPMLQNREFLGIISSRDLRTKLSDMFGIKHIELYQIKGESRFPGDVTQNHYPEHFEWLKANIKVPYPGALFFVGAGALGKVYCDVIKQRGGIAIDVGAIFDAWAGVKSRLTHPSHSLERYTHIPEIDVEAAVARYNTLIRERKLDTPKALLNNMKGSLQKW